MKRIKIIRFIFVLLLLGNHQFLFSQNNVSGELEVNYLNVGQADAILLFCPTGEHKILIDAGDTRYPGSSVNFKTSMQNLLSPGSTIDLVIASHPHADHIGNMKWVFENYKVSRYIDNGQEYDSNLYDTLMSIVYNQCSSGSLKYKPADYADADFTDFCPAENVASQILITDGLFDDCRKPNNCSVVIKVIYNKTSFLFPGDAEEKEEDKLLADNDIRKKLNSDVLKAPHHGSGTSSTYEFLKKITPRYIVVSVGDKDVGTNSTYNHPQLETISNFNRILKTKKYRAAKVNVFDHAHGKWVMRKTKERILFTNLDGNVVIVSNGSKIWFKKNQN